MLKILRLCGFDDAAIRFIFAYLTGRSMFTQGSEVFHYTCGVGQGSGPGGNLFLIFINAVLACFLFLLVILFVDDAQGFLHSSVENINLAIERANHDSEALVQWSRTAGIALNPDKVQAIIIGSRHNLRKLNSMALQPLIVDGVVVPLSDCVSSLGLKIAGDLRWHQHISDVIAASNRILYFLNSKARQLPVKVKKLLATQLLFPRFDYACVAFIDISGELAGKMERQLNKAVRFVFNLQRRASTADFRRKLNWLSLYQRRQYFLLTLTYKVLKTKTPRYLYDLLKPHIIDYATVSTKTRQQPFFKIPRTSSRSLDTTFTFSAMCAWNSLSIDIREAENAQQFKSKLKAFFLSDQ